MKPRQNLFKLTFQEVTNGFSAIFTLFTAQRSIKRSSPIRKQQVVPA